MDTLIINIGQLVTPTGRVPAMGERMGRLSIHEDVEMLVRDGRIVAIDPRGANRPGGDPQTVDAAGRVVLPGLVDAHVHMGLPPFGSEQAAACGDDLPISTGRSGSQAHETRYRTALQRILANGTTTIELKCTDMGAADGIEHSLAMVRDLSRRTRVRIAPTFLGTPADQEVGRRADRVSTLISDLIPAIRRQQVAQFCDVVVGSSGYSFDNARTFLRAARGAGLRLKVHGSDLGNDGAALLAAELEAASVDHLGGADKLETARLLGAGTIPVLTPGSAFLDLGTYPDARRMLEAGLPIALGSDYGLCGWGVESMWTVLYLATARMGLRIDEAITAATLNSAGALDLGGEVGTLEPGKLADVIFLDLDTYREIPLCVGRNPVSMVMVGGEVLAPA